jgi:hypothetical protein
VISRRSGMRLAQAMLVLVLGLSVNTARGGACFGCESCSEYNCPSQNCTHCPASWYGSCYAGTEGCEHYGCSEEPDDCCAGATCRNFCYCEPCI